MTDLPHYLTDDVEPNDFDHFGSRVTISVMGGTDERLDDDTFNDRKTTKVLLRDSTKAELEWTKKLGSSIVNLEAWLHDHWLETIDLDDEINISERRSFFPDFKSATVEMDLVLGEVVKAARQRAKEDSTHFLYVLGNWTYLAEKNDHVEDRVGHKLHRFFERAKQNSINPPNDATCDEYRGGRDDW